jgi:16S rRNA (cytidine1402-2'-O)-methyltransferase
MEIVNSLTHFAVENEKSARKFIKKLLPTKSQQELQLFLLDKKTESSELSEIINQIKTGVDFGIMSEAGMPGIADPGAKLVELAHKNNLPIKTLIGPSSLFLALAGSGLNGQNFSFHGYLPIDKIELKKQLTHIQNLSAKDNSCHLFIETPYRNNQLLESILSFCHSSLQLCVASDLTCESEYIKTQSIANWKKNKPDLHKKPTIFIIQQT